MNASEISTRLQDWIGSEAPNRKQTEAILWALTQDADLRAAFAAVTPAEQVAEEEQGTEVTVTKENGEWVARTKSGRGHRRCLANNGGETATWAVSTLFHACEVLSVTRIDRLRAKATVKADCLR
jgi:hypothetical protein